MTRPAPRRIATRSGWFALSVTVLARSALTIMVSLLGWSLAPAALGWHTTVVMTGSMLPKLVPGDLVVSRPIDPAKLSIGQVVLVDNPDHHGQLRLHRFVRVATDGRLILRGDANRTADSSPVARSAVHGVAALHIPYLGRPVLWANEGQVVPLVLTALALLALLRFAFWWRPAEVDEAAYGRRPTRATRRAGAGPRRGCRDTGRARAVGRTRVPAALAHPRHHRAGARCARGRQRRCRVQVLEYHHQRLRQLDCKHLLHLRQRRQGRHSDLCAAVVGEQRDDRRRHVRQ